MLCIEMSIWGEPEKPASWLKVIVLARVFPPLIDLKYMSLFTALIPCHTTCASLPEVDICGEPEKPASWLKLIVLPKLAPLFLLALKYISLLFPTATSCQITYTSLPVVVTSGEKELPVLLLLRFS